MEKKFSVDYHRNNWWSLDLRNQRPRFGNPGKKEVAIEVFYGASKPARLVFTVEAEDMSDVLAEIKNQKKQFEAKSGIKDETFYKIISIEDV